MLKRYALLMLAAALMISLGCGPAQGEGPAHVLADQEAMDVACARVVPDVVPGFLPVFMHAKTKEKVIALTIDDCNQPENLQQMVDLIAGCGGRATILPIGENVEFVGKVLRYAWKKGFEIENHTLSHSGLYYEDDGDMARQIWEQNELGSQALGVRYQMHFLRPRGGDNRYDQRTHAYLRQMGYYGIAYWDKVALHWEAWKLAANCAPGDVILYHTTAEDLAHMQALVPALQKAGYRFVTLNELFGLPENEVGEWDGLRDVEAPLPYQRFDQMFHREDYLHDVLLMQARLSALGYLEGSYNGYYGERTERAVKAFQQDAGLNPDGICGPLTWQKLGLNP